MKNAAWLLSLVLLAACDTSPEESNTALEGRISALESKLEELDRSVSSIRSSDTANLSIDDDKAYSYVKAGLGTVTVALIDVDTAPGGSKIALNIGNPLNADISRFTIIGFCEAISGRTLPIEITKTHTLAGGHWNRVEIPVSGLAPADFKSITITELVVERTSMLR